ncbi:MAG: LPS assembly lipoprotein LptE [Bacteroidota bacterium]
MHNVFVLIAACILLFNTSACYSFRGISIPDGAERVAIDVFTDNALNAPPTLALEATEELRNKVRDEARLLIVEDTPDLEFVGTLVDFRVTAEAPQPGEFAALNKLTIVVLIEYTNHMDENDEGWRQNFSFDFPFPGSTTLASVQDEAIGDILDNITEQIFNKAFTDNW